MNSNLITMNIIMYKRGTNEKINICNKSVI